MSEKILKVGRLIPPGTTLVAVRKMQVGDPRARGARVVQHGEAPHRAEDASHDLNAMAQNHDAMLRPDRPPQREESTMPSSTPQASISEEDLARLVAALRSGAARIDPATIAALRNGDKLKLAAGLSKLQEGVAKLMRATAGLNDPDVAQAIAALKSMYSAVEHAVTATYSLPSYSGASSAQPSLGSAGGNTSVSESAVAAGPAPQQPQQTSADLHKAAVAQAAAGATMAQALPLNQDMAPALPSPEEAARAAAIAAHEQQMRALAHPGFGTQLVQHGTATVKSARPTPTTTDEAWALAGLSGSLDIAPVLPGGSMEPVANGVLKDGGVSIHDLLADDPAEAAKDAAYAQVGMGGANDMAEDARAARRREALLDLIEASGGKVRR